jgi:acyl CoA:acetate/3-ketoacid CoA transferase beta subunit
VKRIYTELGIFEPRGDLLVVHGLAESIDLEHVVLSTAAPVELSDQWVVLPRPT